MHRCSHLYSAAQSYIHQQFSTQDGVCAPNSHKTLSYLQSGDVEEPDLIYRAFQILSNSSTFYFYGQLQQIVSHLSLHPFNVRAGKTTLLTLGGQDLLDSLARMLRKKKNKLEKSIMGIMSSPQGKYGRRAKTVTGLSLHTPRQQRERRGGY